VARPRDRSSAAGHELRRARLIVGVGVLAWATIAALVMMRYGTIASFVLVGWGGSMVVCLAATFGPFAMAELRPAAPVAVEAVASDDVAADEPPSIDSIDVIDLRDVVLEQYAEDELVLPLG
jgi:hypothetical protein